MTLNKTAYFPALVVFLLFAASPGRAEETSQLPKNSLMFNAPALAAETVSLEYERALTNWFGLGLRGNSVLTLEMKGGKNDEPGDDYDWIYQVRGYGGGLSARFYLSGKAPCGFYLGPRIDFISFSGTYEDRAHNEEPVDTSLSLLLLHGEIGYKFVIAQHWVIGLFADAGFVNAQAEDASALLALLYLAGGGVYLGFAF